ncbi:hypothetical protein [Ruoffia sp. FAM 26254]|uniref:hypothetical protein n=1 Tax=Ruoffia sp. FAM 26254 TaxID=3259518 RepID=UPI003884DBC4
MLITTTGIKQIDSFHEYKSPKDYYYYYNGLFFLRGKKAGLESVKELAKTYESTNQIDFEKLYGAFSFVIKDPNGKITIFSDNSNMHCVYYSKESLSSSFLENINYLTKNQKVNFNDESLTEFYTLGNVYFGKTLIEEISVSKSSDLFIIENNKLIKTDKNINSIEEKSTINNPIEFLNDVAFALSEEKTCIALTGGYDSRLLFSGLGDKIDITPTISGNKYDSKDISIASKIAGILGKKMYVVETPKPEINNTLIYHQFKIADGMINFFDDYKVRWNIFREKLKEDGFKFHISGDGGVLHKDWEWLQDFPFYNKKRTDIKRYYYHRIAFNYRENNIGGRLKNNLNGQEERFLKELSKYKKETNTETYDSLYNYVNGNRKLQYNISAKEFSSYAPLQEIDWVRYSYDLPRKKRYFNFFIRGMTSKLNKEIAQEVTNWGTTASNEWSFILRDYFVEARNYSIKGLRLIGRKVFKKTLFIEKVIDWTIFDEFRELDIIDQAIDNCIKMEILSPSTTKNELTNEQISRVTHIHLLAKYMQNTN